jgi:predicted PurR-regulated permease PerM
MALHPLVILLTVAAGTALFGIVGAVLALPMVAVGLNVAAEWRDRNPSAGAPVMAVNSSA